MKRNATDRLFTKLSDLVLKLKLLLRRGKKMEFLSAFENGFLRIADLFFAIKPQPVPSIQLLKNCKIVSHRGEYDNRRVFENTLHAFDMAKKQGIWGIEYDIRWTKDLQPVVIHDPDLRRVFASTLVIRQTTLSDLKSKYPLVPSLAEVIQRYGKTMHMMIEVKKEVYPDPSHQNRVLKDLFSSLVPGDDFHFISLTPEIFEVIEFVPMSTFLPIARLNFYQLSNLSLQNNFGGLCAHYLVLTEALMERHHKRQQKVGIGYPRSKNSLFRELNRGADWIFSNDAIMLQKVVNGMVAGPTP